MNACPYPTWLADALPAPDARLADAACARQSQLTKPAGSLGELETVAVRLAALQSRERPSAQRVHITVFAADHGVAAEGVSAYPQAVTAQMIDNFASGGAAIAVLARSATHASRSSTWARRARASDKRHASSYATSVPVRRTSHAKRR